MQYYLVSKLITASRAREALSKSLLKNISIRVKVRFVGRVDCAARFVMTVLLCYALYEQLSPSLIFRVLDNNDMNLLLFPPLILKYWTHTTTTGLNNT